MLDSSIYHSLFCNSSVNIILLAPTAEATILDVNDAFLRTSSRKRDELIGKSVFIAFPDNPDDQEDSGVAALRKSIATAIESGQPDIMSLQRYAVHARQPDGSDKFEERYWSASNTPIFGEDGKLVCISHRTADVTKRHRANEDLKVLSLRQAFQIELAEHTRPLADPEEVTAAASALLGKYLGAKRVIYGEADECGEHLALSRDWTDGTLASMAGMRLTLNDFGSQVADVVRAGRMLAVADITTNADSAPYAATYLATGIRSFLAIPLMKEGRLRAVLSVHDSVAHPWTESDIAMANDMVDRTWFAVESARAHAKVEEAEQAVRHSEERLREGLVAARMAVWDWDIVTGEVNFAASAAEAIGLSWVTEAEGWSVVHPDDRAPLRAAIDQALAQRSCYEMAVRMIRPNDKEVFWIEIRGTVQCDEGGTPQSIRGVFIDITDRKRAEEALREEHRRKDEFLAMLAHELRNPLSPISAAAELLPLIGNDENRIMQTTQIISRQIGHITKIVDDLLDVSRVSRGLVTIEKEPTDLRLVICEAVDQVTPFIDARHQQLTVQMPPEPARTLGDRTRLVQIIANLLINAAKYTTSAGEIHLSLQVRKDDLEIRVRDTGIGISSDLLPHVFDLFVQGKRTIDRSQGGLGLGLALVKNLVGLHEGGVLARSEGEGKGSEFTIRLPRLIELNLPCEIDNTASNTDNAASGLNILVVDDNVDAAQTLGLLLEVKGHNTWIEYDATSALRLAAKQVPDVFILDIGLPDMDGYELAKRLQEKHGTEQAIYIALTGYGQTQDREQAKMAGFHHHLVKPIDVAKVSAILASAVAH